MEWRKHKPDNFFYKGTTAFWQAKINGVYVNVVEYPPYPDCEKKNHYEMDFQLEENSPIEMTMNVKVFTYWKKDFKQFEKDAKKLLELLIKS